MRFVLYKWKSSVSQMCVRENVIFLYQLPGEYGSLKSNLLSRFVGLGSYRRYFMYFFVGVNIYAWHKASIQLGKVQVFSASALPFLHLTSSGSSGFARVYLLFCYALSRTEKILYFFKIVQIIGEL